MKWYVFGALAVLAAIPAVGSAQQIQSLPIGRVAQIPDPNPTLWGMSGMDLFILRSSVGNLTPIMRTEMYDARLVEILSRTQAPPLRASDIRVVSQNGHDYITVRRYLLLEVMPQDAHAERMSKAALARKWAAQVRRVIPQVAPMPSRFGV